VTNRTWINNSQEARRERRCMPHVTGVGEFRPGNYTLPVPSGVDHMGRVTTQQAVWNALTFPRLCRTLAAASHALRKTRAIARRSNVVGRSVSILVTFVSHAKKKRLHRSRGYFAWDKVTLYGTRSPSTGNNWGPTVRCNLWRKKITFEVWTLA